MKKTRSHLVCVVSINCNRILFSVTSNLGIKKPQITTTPTKADAKAKPPNNPQVMVVSIGSLFTEKLHKELYYLLSPEMLSSVLSPVLSAEHNKGIFSPPSEIFN